MSAAQLAEPPRLDGNGSAVPVLARTVMGICQEALIAQDLPTAPALLVASNHESSAAFPVALPPAWKGLSTEGKSTGPIAGESSFNMAADAPAVQAGPDMHSSRDNSAVQPVWDELDAAGADGADVMRSVFLKEAALLYFSPAMQRLASSETAGTAKPPHWEVPSTHRCQVCVNMNIFTCSACVARTSFFGMRAEASCGVLPNLHQSLVRSKRFVVNIHSPGGSKSFL